MGVPNGQYAPAAFARLPDDLRGSFKSASRLCSAFRSAVLSDSARSNRRTSLSNGTWSRSAVSGKHANTDSICSALVLAWRKVQNPGQRCAPRVKRCRLVQRVAPNQQYDPVLVGRLLEDCLTKSLAEAAIGAHAYARCDVVGIGGSGCVVPRASRCCCLPNISPPNSSSTVCSKADEGR